MSDLARWVALAEEAVMRLSGEDQRYWLDRLEAAHHNLRAALAEALSKQNPTPALKLSVGLTAFWRIRGHLSEGRRWLELALRRGDEAPPQLRAKALWALGLMAHLGGDPARAQQAAQQALALAEDLDDDGARARALALLGCLTAYSASPREALALLDRSLALARAGADASCLVDALLWSASASSCPSHGEGSPDQHLRQAQDQLQDRACPRLERQGPPNTCRCPSRPPMTAWPAESQTKAPGCRCLRPLLFRKVCRCGHLLWPESKSQGQCQRASCGLCSHP